MKALLVILILFCCCQEERIVNTPIVVDSTSVKRNYLDSIGLVQLPEDPNKDGCWYVFNVEFIDRPRIRYVQCSSYCNFIDTLYESVRR